MDLGLQCRHAEARARRFGHELAAWTPVSRTSAGEPAAYVAECQYCGSRAFAHPRLTDYGEAASRPCVTVQELFAAVLEAA